jgi:hypothetical protein
MKANPEKFQAIAIGKRKDCKPKLVVLTCGKAALF